MDKPDQLFNLGIAPDGTGGDTGRDASTKYNDHQHPPQIASNLTEFNAWVAGTRVVGDGVVYNGSVYIWDGTGAVEIGKDPDAIHNNVDAEIDSLVEKVVPVAGDLLLIEDSAAGYEKKKIQAGNLPAGLPSGAAGGDLSGTYPNPEVSAITETSGPDQLTIGSVSAGEILRRVGTSLVGENPANAALTGIMLFSSGVITTYSSIGSALASSISGDTVYVPPGTYNESITIPAGVRVIGFPASQNVVIAGVDATSTRVTFAGAGTLREVTVLGPSAGANPGISITALGAADVAVLYTVVHIGQGGTGNAVTLGASGVVLSQDNFHNGGNYGGEFFYSSGAALITQGGFANAGSLGGSYFRLSGAKVEFTSAWTIRTAVSSAGSALHLEAGSSAQGTITLEQSSNVSKGVWIAGENVTVELIGADLRAATNDLYVDLLTGVGTEFVLQACLFRQDTVINLGGSTWALNAEVLVQYIDTTSTDDRAVRIGGELSVGATVNPAEASIGEGDSNTQGMFIFTDDGTGTSFIDQTATLKSRSGSTAALLQGTGIGQTLYIGNAGRRFPAMKPLITTAMVWGSGTGVWEFSLGGSSWQEFNILYRDDNANGEQYAQEALTVLSSTKATKVNFCTIAASSSWLTDTVNGQSAYWIRFRVTGAITTAPIAERVKLSTNSVEIDNTGIQFHGSSRPVRKLFVHQALSNDLNGASPTNELITVSANIGLTPADNEFVNGQNDGFGGFISVPPGIDTSSPISFRVGWFPTTAGSGEAKLKVYVATPITVGTDIDSGTVPEAGPATLWDTRRPSGTNQTGAIPSVEATTTGELYISETTVDIPDVLPGDVLAYALRRNDNSDPDAYSGNIVIAYIEAEAHFWRV